MADPHLSGTAALAWIEGVQSKKVMTSESVLVVVYGGVTDDL